MPGNKDIQVSLDDAQAASEAALVANGLGPVHAAATARSIIAAEADGNRAVGLAHLLDYCDALKAGRVGGAAPVVEQQGCVVRIDANGGFPFLGVDLAWPGLVDAARAQGVAILSLRNGYTCGALGYFARRLADGGLVGLVAANAGPAVMPASGGRTPVFCTNPLAFAAPCGDEIVAIDQSSTESAIVAIQQAADAGEPIPEGWAVDAGGAPTTDPAAALGGSLLPFGGARGANIALMVEILAAGLTGGNWSADAPAFNSGNACPGVGLLIVAIEPGQSFVDGRPGGFARHGQRLLDLLQRDAGVYIPGLAKSANAKRAGKTGLRVDPAVWAKVQAEAG